MNGVFNKIISYIQDSPVCQSNVTLSPPSNQETLTAEDRRRYRKALKIQYMDEVLSDCHILTELSDVTSTSFCDDESASSSSGSGSTSNHSSVYTTTSEGLTSSYSSDSSDSSTYFDENMYYQTEIQAPVEVRPVFSEYQEESHDVVNDDKYRIDDLSVSDKYVTMGEIRESMSIDTSRDGQPSTTGRAASNRLPPSSPKESPHTKGHQDIIAKLAGETEEEKVTDENVLQSLKIDYFMNSNDRDYSLQSIKTCMRMSSPQQSPSLLSSLSKVGTSPLRQLVADQCQYHTLRSRERPV